MADAGGIGAHGAARIPASIAGSDDGVLVARASDGVILYVNPAYAAVAGRDAADLVGRTAVETGLASAERAEWILERSQTPGRTLRYNRTFERDGRPVEAELSLHSVEVDGERLVIATLHDVKAAATATESDLIGALFEDSPAGVVIFGPGLRIERVNPAAERLGGIGAAHVGETVGEAFPRANGEAMAAVGRVFRTGEPVTGLERATDDGRHLLVNVFPIARDGDRVVRVASLFVDVTERVAAERRSRDIAAIVDSTDAAVFSKSLDAGTILTWNAGAERIYGWPAAEAIGRPVTIIVPLHLRAEVDEITATIAAGGRVTGRETTRLRKDGALIDVSVNISPIHDEHGRPVAASVIARDVTAERAAVRALNDSERRRRAILASMLQAEEAERSRIATSLHDDTVQVMTASLLALDRVALIARKAGEPGVEEAIAVARATLEEATDRTRRLMFELRPAILHERGIVPALDVLAEQVARETGARATVRGDVGRLPATTEELLYRSAQEALANVRKHAAAESVSISLRGAEGRVVAEIADDGRGFDPEVVSLRPGAAMHLGLDSLTERVRTAGGDVSVESAPGAGTRVRIALPLDPVVAA